MACDLLVPRFRCQTLVVPGLAACEMGAWLKEAGAAAAVESTRFWWRNAVSIR